MRLLLTAAFAASLLGMEPLSESGLEQTAATPGPATCFVVFLHPGPRYDRSLPPAVQPGFAEHAAYMESLEKAGTLVLGGPFIEDVNTMRAAGAMLILAADTPEEARRIAEADPAQASGLLQLGEIRLWVVAAGSWKH